MITPLIKQWKICPQNRLTLRNWHAREESHMLFVPLGVENTVIASGSLPDSNWRGKQATFCEASKGSSGEEGEGVIAILPPPFS